MYASLPVIVIDFVIALAASIILCLVQQLLCKLLCIPNLSCRGVHMLQGCATCLSVSYLSIDPATTCLESYCSCSWESPALHGPFATSCSPLWCMAMLPNIQLRHNCRRVQTVRSTGSKRHLFWRQVSFTSSPAVPSWVSNHAGQQLVMYARHTWVTTICSTKHSARIKVFDNRVR